MSQLVETLKNGFIAWVAIHAFLVTYPTLRRNKMCCLERQSLIELSVPKIALHNVCAVHWREGGCSLHREDIKNTLGDSWVHGGCSVHQRDTIRKTRGHHDECGEQYMSTLGDVQYTGISIQIQWFSEMAFTILIMVSPAYWHPQCPQWYPSCVLHRHFAGRFWVPTIQLSFVSLSNTFYFCAV